MMVRAYLGQGSKDEKGQTLSEASSNENLATTVSVNGQVSERTAYHCDQVCAASEEIGLARQSSPWIIRHRVAHLVPAEASDPK